MADYVWWFLIVGLAVGGVLVAAISMDSARRDEDIEGEEREAEATLIAAQLSADGRPIDRAAVADVLQAHRDYRRLPPPDSFEPMAEVDDRVDDRADDPRAHRAADRARTAAGSRPPAASDDDELALAGLVRARARDLPSEEPSSHGSAPDAHPDREPDEVGHGGSGGADQDLPPA